MSWAPLVWVQGSARRIVAAAVLAALLVTLPGLWGSIVSGKGYIVDDFMQLCAWRGCSYPSGPVAGDLFRFVSGDPQLNLLSMEQGALPWFAHPELKITFWRPLSAWLHWLDGALFEGSVVAAKVHSIAWYLALVGVVAALYVRLLPRGVGGLAALIFAVAATHFQPALWVAARNANISSLFALLALFCVIELPANARRASWLLPSVFYLVALAAGEVALGALCYLVLYQPCVAPATGSRYRWQSSAALALLSLAWLVAYKVQGYGALHSGDYLDPLGSPVMFLQELPRRLLALLAMGYLGFPGDLWLLAPSSQPLAMVTGGLALIIVASMTLVVNREWQPHERRVFVWMASASTLALLPPAAGGLAGRSLLLPSVGISVVIALLIVGCRRSVVRGLGLGRLRPSCWFAGSMLAFIHVLVAPVAWVVGAVFYFAMLTRIDNATRDALDQTAGRTGILLQTPDVFVGRYLPFERRSQTAPAPVVWRALSLARAEHRVLRTAREAFELEVVGGRMLDTPLEKIMRAPNHPLHPGDEVRLSDMRVTIKATDGVGPTRVEFRFLRALEDPNLAFFAWRNGRVDPFVFPAVGQSVSLPWTLGPSGL